ncbi:MAG: TonB-dependent receptor [bacterium]
MSIKATVLFAALIFTSTVSTNDKALAIPRHTHSELDSGIATISGFVTDSASGETIVGARVRIRALKIGAVSNKSGYYTLHVPTDEDVMIEVSSVGYQSITEQMKFSENENIRRNFMMRVESIKGNEVTVEAVRNRVQETQISQVTIAAKQVHDIPRAGEADLFRILQLLPGVQTSSEISSGLYIRGGSPDQNLILLNGTVLYNPSHFFGFFSTFNPDAIKDVELIKGGFPAEYGGRLSAVLSVTDIDGDRNTTKGKFSLGLISSRATIETPVGSGALVLSGRRTYIDVVLKAAGLQDQLELPAYYFYDLNAKITQNPSPNDKISLSGYLGSDHLDFAASNVVNNITMGWGNKAAALEWTHIFGNDLFSKIDINASNFSSGFTFGSSTQPFRWDNAINDYTARFSLEYNPNDRNSIRTGIQGTVYHTRLKIQVGDNPASADLSQTPFYGALYVQDEWKPSLFSTDPLAITAGLRLDKISSNSEIGIDPRLSLRYIINPSFSIKASYGIYHQYLKLASNQLISVFDIWSPTDEIQGPQRADQYVLGISTAPWENYTFEIETYYKKMYNLAELRPNIRSANSLEDVLFVGNGKSYGVEFFLQKQVGRLTGWFGYTLAWTWRTFPDINQGKEYPPTYDRRNDFNLVLTYMLNDRWTLGTTATYGTGQAYTQITALAPNFENPAHTIPIEGDKNSLRLPPYNRLDLSATHHFSLFSKTRNAEFDIDIYNVYNYRNVWISQVDQSGNPAQIKYVRLLPILPTVSISVQF